MTHSRPRIHIYIQFRAKITKKIVIGIFRIILECKEIKALVLLTQITSKYILPKEYKFLVRRG